MDIEELIKNLDYHITNHKIRIAEGLAQSFAICQPDDPLAYSGFAIVDILFSYFEMIGQIRNGKLSNQTSKQTFTDGFREVWPDSSLGKEKIEEIYNWVRNGLYHSGIVKKETGINRYAAEAVSMSSCSIEINPILLVRDTKAHFVGFIAQLRNPENIELRKNFKNVIELFYAGNKPCHDDRAPTTTAALGPGCRFPNLPPQEWN